MLFKIVDKYNTLLTYINNIIAYMFKIDNASTLNLNNKKIFIIKFLKLGNI